MPEESASKPTDSGVEQVQEELTPAELWKRFKETKPTPAEEKEFDEAWSSVLELDQIDRSIAELTKAHAPTVSDIVARDELLAALENGRSRILALLEPSASARPLAGVPLKPSAVSSHDIMAHFWVKPGDNINAKWWNQRMRDAKRYGLLECRASRGRGNRPSMWHPDEIAAWLVEHKHMSSKNAAGALRKFAGSAEQADRIEDM